MRAHELTSVERTGAVETHIAVSSTVVLHRPVDIATASCMLKLRGAITAAASITHSIRRLIAHAECENTTVYAYAVRFTAYFSMRNLYAFLLQSQKDVIIHAVMNTLIQRSKQHDQLCDLLCVECHMSTSPTVCSVCMRVE